jgi:hypothetical protein
MPLHLSSARVLNLFAHAAAWLSQSPVCLTTENQKKSHGKIFQDKCGKPGHLRLPRILVAMTHRVVATGDHARLADHCAVLRPCSLSQRAGGALASQHVFSSGIWCTSVVKLACRGTALHSWGRARISCPGKFRQRRLPPPPASVQS